ncbi:MAG: M48 family metalloprotease [bacterium]
MLQLCLIAAFASLFLHDGQSGGAGAGRVSAAGCAGFVLGVHAGLFLFVWVRAVLADWAIVKTGSLGSITGLDRTANFARVAGTLTTGYAIVSLGWLEAIGWLTGGLPLLDPVLALTPLLMLMLGCWWAMYPIERRLTEAVLFRQLEDGTPVYPIPSRLATVWMHTRHQMLLVLIPMLLLWGWGQLLHLLRSAAAGAWESGRGGVLAELGRWLASEGEGGVQGVMLGAQLLGVVGVLLLTPGIMRRLWQTVPLRDGPLAERMLTLAHTHRVRVAGILIWRTGGGVVNGAVLGVVGWSRYILLTDALLERLAPRHVEGVMAHEVGHVRLWHIPWLIGATMAASALSALGVQIALNAVQAVVGGSGWEELELLASVCSLLVALLVFGFVSRRFEWQADAFAAKHLSATPDEGAEQPQAAEARGTITEQGALGMAGALLSVASLNGIPRGSFGFRHGSIDSRVARLRSLVGQRQDRLPIDRTVRWIKGATGLALVLVALAVAFGVVSIF